MVWHGETPGGTEDGFVPAERPRTCSSWIVSASWRCPCRRARLGVSEAATNVDGGVDPRTGDDSAHTARGRSAETLLSTPFSSSQLQGPSGVPRKQPVLALPSDACCSATRRRLDIGWHPAGVQTSPLPMPEASAQSRRPGTYAPTRSTTRMSRVRPLDRRYIWVPHAPGSPSRPARSACSIFANHLKPDLRRAET
jgi:hypothetical protein